MSKMAQINMEFVDMIDYVLDQDASKSATDDVVSKLWADGWMSPTASESLVELLAEQDKRLAEATSKIAELGRSSNEAAELLIEGVRITSGMVSEVERLALVNEQLKAENAQLLAEVDELEEEIKQLHGEVGF